MSTHRPLGLGALIVLSCSIAACASVGIVAAEFDIAAQARLSKTTGGESSEESLKLGKLPRFEWQANPFSNLRYEGDLFSATIAWNTDNVNATFQNKSRQRIILRFDEATFSSNLHPAELPLRSWGGIVHKQFVPNIKGQIATLPSMKLSPGETGGLTMAPSYTGLYPSGRLFGVEFAKSPPQIIKSGVGNSIRLKVPVDLESGRVYWLLDMTAVQEKVRTTTR